MRETNAKAAVLPNAPGTEPPALPLAVAARFQFCVDAGAASAVCFFDDMTTVGLHDHVALSMHAFMASLEGGPSASPMGELLRANREACVDAFAAGYLGRIQQELRLFKPGRVDAAHDAYNRRRSAH